MRIAVLMTCYNRVATTLACLEALFRNGGCNLDVWLVDDASPDKTGEKVKAKYPSINVIKGTGSLYWAKGMHLAWESAVKSGGRFDFFLWLNDDVMLKSDAISGLLSDYAQLTTNHQPLTTAPVIVGACEWDGECTYGVTDLKYRKVRPIGKPQLANGWLNGNVVLVPWATYQAVGMVCPDYTHARADYDYAERLKKAGIPFYGSFNYVGTCRNDYVRKMQGMPFCQRMKLLVRPSYWNLHDLWLIRRRHHGIMAAIVSCIHLIFIAAKGVR